jgi:hypothetical protein
MHDRNRSDDHLSSHRHQVAGRLDDVSAPVEPLFPLGTLLANVSRERAYRVAVAVAFAAGSVIWLAVVWRSKTMAP